MVRYLPAGAGINGASLRDADNDIFSNNNMIVIDTQVAAHLTEDFARNPDAW